MDTDTEKARIPQTGTDVLQPDAAGILNPDERLLDWSSPDDPDCGQNWALPVKIYHTAVASAMGFLITFTAAIYIPSIHSLTHKFREVSTIGAIIPFSIFVLGYAFGPIIAAPCSETFGRRIVYWTCIPCYAFFILGAGLAKTFPTLIICRFLAGIFGSPGVSIGSGVIADIWRAEERIVPMAAFVVSPFVGPTVGALVGGFVVKTKDWRWTQWTTLFFFIAIYISCLFTRETYKKTILTRRARRLGLSHSSHQLISTQSALQLITFTLIRPMHMLLTEPVVGLLSLYVAFAFATVYAFYAAIPWTFERAYTFSITSQGLVFLSLTIGYVGAIGVILTSARLLKERLRRRKAAVIENAREALPANPEENLTLAMLGSPLLPLALFTFGWTARHEVHWIVPMAAIVMLGGGTLLIFVGTNMYIMNTYGPLYGASAIAANRFLSFLFGVAFPLFTIQNQHLISSHPSTKIPPTKTKLYIRAPKRVYVDNDEANEYSSEGVLVVPNQIATPQTANLSGRPGQSSMKKGKAGVEGAGLSHGVQSSISDFPDHHHDPPLADPPPDDTNYFSDSGTIESLEFPTPPEELSEEVETPAEEEEDPRRVRKSPRLHIDKGSLGDSLVSGGNPRSDTKPLASTTDFTSSLPLDSIQPKALIPSSPRDPQHPNSKIRRPAQERRSGSEEMTDPFYESTDEDNPSPPVLKPPSSSSSRRPDSARVELSQQKHRNSLDSNQRIMAPRSTTKKPTSAAEPELIMPSIHEDGLGGSWAVEDKPRRRGSKAVIRTSNNVIPVKSGNLGTPEKHRPPKTVPSTSKRSKSSTPMSDHATTFLLKPAGNWIYDVLGNTLHKIKTPLSYFLAIWIFLGLVVILRNLFTNSIYSALSPICRIPGSSLLSLPMCRHLSRVSPSVPTPSDLPPVQFDRLMTVQSQFESILQEAAGGVSLPFEMKSSEASIRNLRQVVRYSSLRSKNELVLEFDGFVETAQIASFDLQKFNSHVGRGVDNILATARWTKRLLDGIAITDSSRGTISSFLNDKILAPFQPVRFTEGIVLEHYIRHTRLVEEEIKRLILEAQALLLTLVNLEDRLDAIHGIVVRDDIHAQLSKTEILSHLWTKLGGNRSKLGKFNSQLHLLGQVNTYRESAIAHVSGTLIKLQAMGAELGELQERVGGVEFLDVGKGGVPLSVHIENIELGVERLEQGRNRAAGVQSEELRRVMNKGRKWEIEAG